VEWLLKYWPLILGVLTAVSGWLINPRAKLQSLRAKLKVDQVQSTIDLDNTIQEKITQMNSMIERHTEQIAELRIQLLDATLLNRTQEYELEQKTLLIQRLEEELAKCRRCPV
jgi:hypothetical protein